MQSTKPFKSKADPERPPDQERRGVALALISDPQQFPLIALEYLAIGRTLMEVEAAYARLRSLEEYPEDKESSPERLFGGEPFEESISNAIQVAWHGAMGIIRKR